ncbi:hypothetical protein ACMG5L_21910 [Escherichia coli]|uniref:hypothetical protein n=1 Tax=Escherichia coli TaxID=562 RepID=UPI0039BFFF2C
MTTPAIKHAHELIDVITQTIASHQPAIAEQFKHDLLARVPEYMTLEHAQAEINRYWRLQFGVLEVSTFSVRECLLDNQPIKGWIHNFRDYVAPFIARNVKSLRGGR